MGPRHSLLKSFFLLMMAVACSRHTANVSRNSAADLLAQPQFKIGVDSTKLKTTFGENFKMNLWTESPNGSGGQVVWTVKAGGLPEGITLLVTGPQSAALTGRVQFLGQWCMQVSAKSQFGSQSAEESFCVESDAKEKPNKVAPSSEILKDHNGQLNSGVSPGVT